MHPLLPTAALAASLVLGCGATFQERRTPSGEYCTDMHVFPAGTNPDREYHRLQPITSDPESRTEAERLESLRKAACEVGGDAVVEAVNEEIRTSDAVYSTVSSGTAVVWVRRPTSDTKPFATYSNKSKPTDAAGAEQEATPPPEAAPSAAPTAPPAPTTSATTGKTTPPATGSGTSGPKPMTIPAPTSSGSKGGLPPKKK